MVRRISNANSLFGGNTVRSRAEGVESLGDRYARESRERYDKRMADLAAANAEEGGSDEKALAFRNTTSATTKTPAKKKRPVGQPTRRTTGKTQPTVKKSSKLG